MAILVLFDCWLVVLIGCLLLIFLPFLTGRLVGSLFVGCLNWRLFCGWLISDWVFFSCHLFWCFCIYYFLTCLFVSSLVVYLCVDCSIAYWLSGLLICHLDVDWSNFGWRFSWNTRLCSSQMMPWWRWRPVCNEWGMESDCECTKMI